ncbi:MAG TPA: serine hydrolase [Eudoraea sp.]|nr:serine hydrolase [Eudoraea sp.]
MRVIKVISTFLIVLIIVGFIWSAFKVFPGVSGYGAKNMCSAIYLQNREPADIIREDLNFFPVTLGTYSWDSNDSSTTGSVWGLANRKAIYRESCGCTLVNDFTETEIRNQQINIPTPPNTDIDTIPWPYGDRITSKQLDFIDYDKLNSAVDEVMEEVTENGKFADTRAVVVLYNGKMIAERYADGYDQTTIMLGWSMSKTITASIVGILVKKGMIDLDDPAPVNEWKSSEKQKITLRQLLQQTSGINFLENYERPSNVTRMLFSEGDMAAYAANLKLEHEPGTHFNYNSGNTNLLCRIIRKLLNEEDYYAFPYMELFYKINAPSFLLEYDASGTFVGSSYCYATARDYARMGLLYYNNGIWNGEQILPMNWIEESVTPSMADEYKQYGFQLWLNGLNPNNTEQRQFPDVPKDMYYIDGYGGQRIFIIPSKKIVVVRLGLYPVDGNTFLKNVLDACKKKIDT